MSGGRKDDSTRVVFVTAPDEQVASHLAETLVSSRLAACANLLPGVTSIYRWKSGVERSTEVLMVIKTVHDRVEELRELVVQEHPYDLPEVVVFKVDGGHDGYLEWVTASCTPSE